MFDRHVLVGSMSSKEYNILQSKRHRAIYHTIESIIALRITNYHCSLLSWNHLQANGQAQSQSTRSIPNCESWGMSPRRIKRTRENTDHWVSGMTKALQEIIRLQWEGTTICVHFVWQREKEMVDLLNCLHCKANLLNECFPLFCLWDDPLYVPSPQIEDHPRGPRRQVQWHCLGFRSSHYLVAAWLDSRTIIVV